MEELLPVVKRLTEKFTGKESTSVTYETAERLMGAVIYCINEYQKEGQASSGSSTEVWDQEAKLSAMEAYERGYQAVINKVLVTKKLYEGIIDDFKWYGNRALYETVIKGMPVFFVHYDARFYPQDHILTLDYPILPMAVELCGVDAIYEYLTRIRIEQIFLSGFSQEMVVQTLLQYHPDYKSLFINLPSIVMKKVIEKMVDAEEYAANHSKAEVEEKMHHALELLVRERYADNRDILNYLQQDIYYIDDMTPFYE